MGWWHGIIGGWEIVLAGVESSITGCARDGAQSGGVADGSALVAECVQLFPGFFGFACILG